MKLISLNLRFGGQKRTESILDYLIYQNADLLVLGDIRTMKTGQK